MQQETSMISKSYARWDSFGSKHYCVWGKLEEFKLERERLEWLPAMIEFFWHNGIQSDQIDFLEKGNFVQYE